jgi:hypothetical protein
MHNGDMQRPFPSLPGGLVLTGAQAARELGVSEDADAVTIRRAWRVWARLAHPDTGGSPEQFDRLRHARDVLLAHLPVPAAPPRPRFRDVVHRPGPRTAGLLVLLGMLAMIAVALPLLAPDSARAVTLAPAALLAAIFAILAARWLLDDCADAGHRIVFVSCAWLPLAAVQVMMAELIGASAVTVLPVMVLPFVVVIAAVNPGAGLTR